MRNLLTSLLACLFCAAWTGEEVASPPPEKQDPVTPERGYYKDYPQAWNQLHASFVARAAKGDIDVLFLGDSITQGWGNQKELWRKEFEPLKAANFGVGGDRTQQVLWRITHGEIDGLHPKVVVLMIGVNNIWPNDPPEQIGAGIKKIVATLREKLPATKVLLLGVLPAFKGAKESIREKIRQINAVAEKLADGTNVRYLDMGPKFTEADGSLAPDKYYQPDFLHLRPEGYQDWADTMRPVLSDMLK